MDILLILLLQLIYVPIYSLRTIFLVKEKQLIASILGFVEALVYVFGLAIIFTGDQSILALIIYAVGFALGIAIGGYIEGKLAIGYTTIVVNLINRNETLISLLREKGFGVTLFVGEGKDSKRYQLEVLTLRSREEELFSLIQEYEPSAFLISYEARKFKGGYLAKAIKKKTRNLNNNDKKMKNIL
ncbi:DUF2179 domain-containing protein [Bacillus sp. PK3_68]|uniref:DUF2179 domain-containing protein n=1 Tax=Bacillus sp. PK3_68 TaxID=2027408 RepID=UPI000E757D1B|nr:DUF2179 domain-containing protein [Bacillus sp. PK3_68]RJS50061.1 hypothetical protein CJ483_22415 [Bacillus sp. PK3_68]